MSAKIMCNDDKCQIVQAVAIASLPHFGCSLGGGSRGLVFLAWLILGSKCSDLNILGTGKI